MDKNLAHHFYGARAAEALRVGTKSISRDLKSIVTTTKPARATSPIAHSDTYAQRPANGYLQPSAARLPQGRASFNSGKWMPEQMA